MNELSRTETGWLVKLQGYRLELASADASLVSLVFRASEDTVNYTVQIETPFSLHLADGREITLQPSAELVGNKDFANINGTTVRKLVLANTGTLTVELDDSNILRVEGSTEYEPWNISGSDGFHAVSAPEPSLSVWLPSKQ